ncbi:12400_t:CDS:1 [Acaulospora colombiana]|uniref:12400_t:CDS:1 n=1 Tax=Acaulospora colombiana TaxID=27376 RepID=A0ACA9NER0_9GLOM|nr:12400_t:CDS:1 [Acaulospora colombiana]
MDSQIVAPSFKELYDKYLKAFNDHSIEGVNACLSPNLEIFIRGKLVAQAPAQWDQMKKSYQEHWALPNCRVTIDYLDEWWDAEKKEGGVQGKLIDWPRAKLMEVKYTYGLEGDEWLQKRHEIGQVVDYDVNSGSRPSDS